MSEALECPRCRGPVSAKAGENGTCPRCGSKLITAAGTKEAEVRAYLYGHRLLPLAPRSGRKRSRSR